MKGVGVGDESATALSATMTWLLRDGAGMAGGIAFTWLRGTDLDHACKKWRLFADVLNDAAMMLELAGPLLPRRALQLVLCAASVARALVGVAGGATRAAVTQHQARANNISDVAAKDGSQETLVNLFALVLNLILLPLLGENQEVIWAIFFCLMAVSERPLCFFQMEMATSSRVECSSSSDSSLRQFPRRRKLDVRDAQSGAAPAQHPGV